MKILHVHAHFDDYEFVAAGTFEMWRRDLPDPQDLRAKIIVCTDGKAGHHFRTREETFDLRLREQQESARIGGYEFDLLRYPDGEPPREACLQLSVPLLAALWKAVRDFEPDYLFCPPVASDPLVGIHNDHVTVAEAVRRVAYMINVPHAFTPEYPVDETKSRPVKVPVILNVHDPYMFGAGQFDLAIDVEGAFEKVSRMTWCHQSQISEWLPWVGRHDMEVPKNLEDWSRLLRRRFERQNKDLKIPGTRATEVFTFTAWGEVPVIEKVLRDFPSINREASHIDKLRQKVMRWKPT